MDKDYSRITNCRVCGSAKIVPLLDLGNQPLANSLKKAANQKESRYPLTFAFCLDCSLVQLMETVKKEVLFDDYVWVTRTSATAREYADIFYKRAIAVTKARPGDFVVEIASNDGTFLKPFIRSGYNVIGIDPAGNLARLANKEGVRTVARYWNRATARQMVSGNGRAKVIMARNVIPHVSDLDEVIGGIQLCLSDEGTGIIEFHYAGTILQQLHYDSIYHEHLCYFSLQSMEFLLNRHKLFSFYIDKSPISGGSYVIYFSKEKRRLSPRYKRLINKEKKLSVNKISSWKKFSERCREHRDKSRSTIRRFADKTIVGFGASARSSTYLNFCNFTRRDIKAIIDNNRLKQGLYTAGSSIPIVSLEEGLKNNPGLLFILAWNFKDEIIKECRRNGYGGDYLIPFPNKPHLLITKSGGKK